jgi:NADH-quinone oxidoreductase subunit L
MAQETLLLLSTIIFLFPLLGFIILIFFGKRIGRPSAFIGTTILGIDLILAIVVAYSKLVTFADVRVIQTKFTWIDLGSQPIDVGIGIDNLSVIMLIVVTLISFLVHMFSIDYMHGDKRFPRFYAYLGIFTFSMLGIVLANNFLFMYVFWELVGLSSYLLIGFWYEKDSAANANKKAFLTNRVGDLGFFIGIAILYFAYGTFMFDDVFMNLSAGIIPFDSGTVLTIAGICIFAGAVGKSAQFPLHVWLPDAMEGPTPVSALIHAATMVAAGVYLVARVFPMFTGDALMVIAYTGAITAFMAATIAITQRDFKRVLAYSTVSQLGYMIMALGVGAFTSGFFHLITHAWFKACLFLGSGSVIHAMHMSMHHANNHSMDAQDINNMGGLRKRMPITYITFLVATLAIAGVPFFSGFMSKDGILAGTLAFGNLSGHWLIPIAGFSAAAMTAFYMFRLVIVSFHGKPKTDIAAHTKENKFAIVFPLIVLSTLSLWFWYAPNPFDAGSGWFAKATPAPATVVPAEFQRDYYMPLHQDHASNDFVLNGYSDGNGYAQDHEAHGTETNEAHEDPTHHTSDAHEGDMPHDGHEHDGDAAHGEHGGGHAALNVFEEEMHAAHYPAMIASLLIAALGIFGAFCVYQFKILDADKLQKQFSGLHKFSFNKWYIDEFYEATFIGVTIFISKVLAWFDNLVIDGLVNLTAFIFRGVSQFVAIFDNVVVDGLVNLSANMMGFIGAVLRKFQTGKVQAYVAMAIIGVMILVYFV